MKAKMIIKYRHAWLFVIGFIFLISIILSLALLFILVERNYTLAILCLILAILVISAFWFRFNYGIKINDKRVILIEQRKLKILKYDNIVSIKVMFTDNEVIAEVKAKHNEEYFFVWDYIDFGYNLILPSQNKIKLNSRIIEKSIASLSKCEKVTIENHYKPL